MEYLIKQIEEKIKECNDFVFPEQDRIDYIEKVLETANISSPTSFYDLEVIEFLKSAILARNPEVPYEIITAGVDAFMPESKRLNHLNKEARMKELDDISNGLYDDVISDDNQNRSQKLAEFIDVFHLDKRPFSASHQLYELYDYIERKHTLFSKAARGSSEDLRKKDGSGNFKRKFSKTLKIESQRYLKEIDTEIPEIFVALYNEVEYMISYYNDNLLKNKKEVEKTNNKRKNEYQGLKFLFMGLKSNMIGAIKGDEQSLLDGEILLDSDMFFAKHNLQIYEKEMNIYKEYHEKGLTAFELMFRKNGFDFNKLTSDGQEKLLEISEIEKLEKMLKQIGENNFGIISEKFPYFSEILLSSNFHILKTLTEFTEKEYIDYDFIARNLGILFSENSDCKIKDMIPNFENFRDVLELMNNKGINLSKVTKYNEYIYKIDKDELKKRLELLNKKYKVKLNSDDITNYDFIEKIDLLDMLDDYIELGYGDVIKNNPHYLQHKNELIIKRLFVANLIRMDKSDILSENGKLNGMIKTGNEFPLGDSDLDQFIVHYSEDYLDPTVKTILDNNLRDKISTEATTHSAVEILDQNYLEKDGNYCLEGINISKTRVLRNLTTLLNHIPEEKQDDWSLVFGAMLYNNISMMTPNQIEDTFNCYKNHFIETDENIKVKQICKS